MAEEAVQKVSEASGEIASLAAELERLLSGDRYIRRSQARRAESFIQQVKRGYAPENRRHPEVKTHNTPKVIDALEKLVADEAGREAANDALVDRQVPAILAATGDLLPNGLTEEQARAIATDEDVTPEPEGSSRIDVPLLCPAGHIGGAGGTLSCGKNSSIWCRKRKRPPRRQGDRRRR